MKHSDIYHSALWKEIPVEGELDFYTDGENIAFRHDMLDAPSKHHNGAGAIYSEPCWREGFVRFMKRAGKENTAKELYSTYLENIVALVKRLGVPSFIMSGKHMLNKLNPDWAVETLLNDGEAWLAGYNAKPMNFKTHKDVITHMVKLYDNILDFSCGYGNICGPCIENKKRFIVSDVNGKCVYYVAKQYLGMV